MGLDFPVVATVVLRESEFFFAGKGLVISTKRLQGAAGMPGAKRVLWAFLG